MSGKRYNDAKELVDKDNLYSMEEAVELVKEFDSVGFNETVELTALLGVDPKHSDQVVRGSVSLPNGLGQERTVLCFAEGEDADDAEEAGADYVGGEELATKIEDEDFLDFDVALAAEYAMKYVGPIGQILGPKGLMPSPKSGTVIKEGNFGQAVKEFKQGRVEFRTDSGGNIHAPVGKDDFPAEKLVENVRYLINQLRAEKPPGASGRYFRKCYLSKTMSPSIRFAP